MNHVTSSTNEIICKHIPLRLFPFSLFSGFEVRHGIWRALVQEACRANKLRSQAVCPTGLRSHTRCRIPISVFAKLKWSLVERVQKP